MILNNLNFKEIKILIIASPGVTKNNIVKILEKKAKEIATWNSISDKIILEKCTKVTLEGIKEIMENEEVFKRIETLKANKDMN